jgi:hypothetical protein
MKASKVIDLGFKYPNDTLINHFIRAEAKGRPLLSVPMNAESS